MAAFLEKTLKQSPVSVFVRRRTFRRELSGRVIVREGNCPVGELSAWRIVRRGIVRSGNCPGGELSGRGIVRLENCPSGNCPSGNCPSGNCPSGNCPSGNCPGIQ